MRYQWGILSGIVLLMSITACNLGPVSPLENKAEISIQGKIQDINASPWAAGTVIIQPNGESVTQHTDTTGKFSVNLLGFETKKDTRAFPIQFSATHATGATLKQSLRVLKSASILPTMQFWDGLEQPAAEDNLRDPTLQFKWQKSSSANEYHLKIFQDKALVWDEITKATEVSLHPGILENLSQYQWQVSAGFTDYTATSQRFKFSTGESFSSALPLKSIQVDGNNEPKLHDGDRQSSVNFDAPKDLEPKTLIIDLGKKQEFKALLYRGGGFSARAQIYGSTDGKNWGERIKTESLGSRVLIELPQSQVQYIKLDILSDGFIRVNEIKILK